MKLKCTIGSLSCDGIRVEMGDEFELPEKSGQHVVDTGSAVKIVEHLTETPTEILSEVPSEILSEVPSEILSEVPSEILSEVPSEILSESPEPTKELPTVKKKYKRPKS